MQRQDAIVARLARNGLSAHPGRGPTRQTTPAANRDAEDLALQCGAGQWKAGGTGKEADAAYALCEQALAIDPVRALMVFGGHFFALVQTGVFANPKRDLERTDELESKALALDPDWTWPHSMKGNILRFQGRAEEDVPEDERALALDTSNMSAVVDLGFDYGRPRAIRQCG